MARPIAAWNRRLARFDFRRRSETTDATSLARFSRYAAATPPGFFFGLSLFLRDDLPLDFLSAIVGAEPPFGDFAIRSLTIDEPIRDPSARAVRFRDDAGVFESRVEISRRFGFGASHVDPRLEVLGPCVTAAIEDREHAARNSILRLDERGSPQSVLEIDLVFDRDPGGQVSGGDLNLRARLVVHGAEHDMDVRMRLVSMNERRGRVTRCRTRGQLEADVEELAVVDLRGARVFGVEADDQHDRLPTGLFAVAGTHGGEPPLDLTCRPGADVRVDRGAPRTTVLGERLRAIVERTATRRRHAGTRLRDDFERTHAGFLRRTITRSTARRALPSSSIAASMRDGSSVLTRPPRASRAR